MSNLVEHARRELELIEEEPEFISGYLKVFQAYADMGYLGESPSVAISIINTLLQFKNLTPLTDDPDEWIYHSSVTWGADDGIGIWQNNRNSEAFSHDSGKTYYLLSENKSHLNLTPVYTSVHISLPPESKDVAGSAS